MRSFFFAALLTLTSAAATAEEGPNARAAYAERRGLIEADSRCGLFGDDIRTALQVGAAQARGALLRSGWSDAQMRTLENAAIEAARARPCGDSRTAAAAEDARLAFARWSSAGTMEFPGWERSWIARRAVIGDASWRLSQTIDAPLAATFGVRESSGTQRLVLVVPMARGEAPPSAATLVMRDRSRSDVTPVSLTRRMAYGVEAGAPPPRAAQRTPSTRTIERAGGARQAVFTFPNTAFRDLLSLDPRESVMIELSSGRSTTTLYAEVGDVDAARAFLTIR